MRIIAFLMAVLVLALSMMPCADVDVIGTNDASHAIVKAAQSHHEDVSDTCSPFCQCSCCAGYYVNHAAAAVAYQPHLPPVLRFPHTPATINDRSLPVWQPPQLG